MPFNITIFTVRPIPLHCNVENDHTHTHLVQQQPRCRQFTSVSNRHRQVIASHMFGAIVQKETQAALRQFSSLSLFPVSPSLPPSPSNKPMTAYIFYPDTSPGLLCFDVNLNWNQQCTFSDIVSALFDFHHRIRVILLPAVNNSLSLS